MKKFKDLTEQYREEGRYKPVIPHNVKSKGVGPRPEVDSSKVKLKEEEQLDEGRPSQRHPLEGHEYHKKSNAELVGIAKDAHEAAEAMKSHNTSAENKYRDQANDSATVRYFRQKSGMPDWYKKKYGHMKEETDTSEKNEMAQTQLHFMKYAAEEILEYIEMGGEIEEWYQNKLSKVQSEVESLHSYVEGEARRTGMKEEFAESAVPSKEETVSIKHKTSGKELRVTKQSLEKYKALGYHPIKESKAESVELDEEKDYHSVHVGGRHWKTFDTKSHAENVAKKIKGATVHRYDAERLQQNYAAKSAARNAARGKQYDEQTEDLQESRQSQIVREAMEAAKKKKKQESADTFNADPTLSSEIVKS